MQPTPEQQRAITTHDRHLIVVAGAGSGKTRVLVERFLALLEANPDWPLTALVAITFTRKAAGEMRDRVRRGLEARLRAAASANAPEAAARWAMLLAAMDSARITTIHGLCGDLLRANAAEVGLDPQFAVLDEGDAALLRAGALDDALATLADDPATGDPARDAAERDERARILPLFDHYDEYRVRETLGAPALLSADLPDLSGDLLAEWRAAWEVAADAALAELAAHPAFAEVADYTLAPGADDDKLGAVWLAAQRIVGRLRAGEARAERFAALEALRDEIKLIGGAAKYWGSKDAIAEAKATLRALRDLAEVALKQIGEPPGDLDELAAQLLPAWTALLARVGRFYRAAKHRIPAVDFDDLEKLTVRLLRAHPHVAARYRGAEFRQLLVDEFQDTNAAQWAIVEALTGPHDRQGLVEGRLFVVGDPKQSIYAFRGADVRVFEAVRAQARRAGDAEVALAESFRTHAPLVERFNALFAHILRVDADGPARAYQIGLGEPMRAFRQSPPGDAPPLELLLIEDRQGRDDDALDGEGRRRLEAAALAGRLRAMVEAGHPVFDRDSGVVRPVGYGDMAVLLQALTHVDLYEGAFRAAGVPFLTIAGRGYYGRQEVHDLLNLLTALDNPADDLALASALRSPLFALSDDALYALRLAGGALWAALTMPEPPAEFPDDEAERLAFARATLARLRAVAGRVTISALLREALDATGYLAALTGLPDGPLRRGNVEKLLDKAQTSGKIRLGAFRYYLRDLSDRELREGDAALDVEGVARIMTVHASKGLEFPVVALADSGYEWERGKQDAGLLIASEAGWGCRVIHPEDGRPVHTFATRRAKALDAPRDEAERRRLLYVAATRAADTLIVSGQVQADQQAESAHGWKAKGWLKWLLDALPALDDPGLRVQVIAPDAVSAHAPAPDSAESPWARREVRGGLPLPGVAPVRPPLLAPLVVEPASGARHLSATAVADLGGAHDADTPGERRQARDRFRRAVLHAAPGYVRPALSRTARINARQVGDMVHEALRYWRLPRGETGPGARHENDDLFRLLTSIAWELGITDPRQSELAVWRAMTLLFNFRRSPLCAELESAAEVYRELPFIFEREAHIVHGVIDVLYRAPDGGWTLVDYKTSQVIGASGARGGVTVGDLRRHARRYHMQLGMYAEAAQAQLGEPLAAVKVHYIRYATVDIAEADWRAALARGLRATVEATMR